MNDVVTTALAGSGPLPTICRFLVIMAGLVLNYFKTRKNSGNSVETLARIERKLDKHIRDHVIENLRGKRRNHG